MMLIVGPDTPKGEVDSTLWRQIDVAPTVGKLLGFTTPFSSGEVIRSAISAHHK
jgi:arylsulfatase A-like enzyme